MRRPRGLLPLRHARFRLLVSSQFGSNIGDAFFAVALPWYVLSAHGGAVLLATVLAAYGVPRTALLAVGGRASDRWRPWTAMMAADTLRTGVLVALAVAAATAPPNATTLVPIAVVLGAGEGIFLPGSMAIVPSLLPHDDLQAGNAVSSGALQLATLIGPGVAGVVVAASGASIAFGVDGVSFSISAITLFGIRRSSAQLPTGDETVASEPAPDATGKGPAAPTAGGVLRREPVLWVILALSAAANLGSGGLAEVALPALVHRPLRGGAIGYGTIIAAFGAGALLGTAVAAQLRPPTRPTIVASIAFLSEALVLGVTPLFGNATAVGAALAAVGAAIGFGNVVVLTAFQRWAPSELLGRLSGLLMLASYGVFPISVIAAGFVVHARGPASFFYLAAGLLALAVAGGLTQRTWRRFGVEGSGGPAA